MRADRLVSLVLMLRQRGQMTAYALAQELEVSTRTVLRDIEALSVAGVPVYAERGRHGGFALLPGFRTELTGLNHDEALALLAAAGAGEHVFGLGSAHASALRKVLGGLPAGNSATASEAASRFLVEPESDLLSRRPFSEDISGPVMVEVRRAVLDGRKLRILYTPEGRETQWRSVDPIGLVTVRGRTYLLAIRNGEDRTYRLSRVTDAEVLTEPAERPDRTHLERIWRERSTRFRAGGSQVVVQVRLDPRRREELVGTALAVLTEIADEDGWLRLEVSFQDARHAEWALWQLSTDAEALAPQSLRAALHDRAVTLIARYEGP